MLQTTQSGTILSKPAFVLCVGFLVASCSGSRDSSTAAAETDCRALANSSIAPESIELPTGGAVISSATYRYTPTVAFCQINGAIAAIDEAAPDINFQVNLPADWNNKGLHYGSNDNFTGPLVTGTDYLAFNSTDPTLPTPLAKGYATWGSDGGHMSSDGSFLANSEALSNFAGDQLKKTYDVAVALMDTIYGRLPEKVYIQGSAQGGREALIAVQRWPQSYDGAVAINPVTTPVGLYLGSVLAEQALLQTNASLDESDISFLGTSVLSACDTLDGDADGVISNIASCSSAFDVQNFRCSTENTGQDGCLIEAQTTALDSIANGFVTAPLLDGTSSIAGWPVYTSINFDDAFSQQSPFFRPAATAASFIRYAIQGSSLADALDFTVAGNEDRIAELSSQMDVSVDFSEFADGGGKVIVLHGASNFDIPYSNTVNWYRGVVNNVGLQFTDSFMSISLIAGFDANVDNTDFQWQTLDALDAWSQRGVEPADLTVGNF